MDAKFKIYTGMLRAYETKSADGTTRKRLKTTASSTIKDLAGDEIQLPAIEKAAAAARDNMTIFLNHSYDVPEDVLGSCEDAQVIQRGVDGDGNAIIDLDFDIGVNEINPRAIQAWESINSGVKLGTSIGAIVRHATKKKGGGLLIDDLDLLEASLVGIPANPRSWVQYAVKGLGQVEEPIVDDEVDEDFEITQAADLVVETTETTETVEETVKDVEPETGDVEPDKEAARTQVTVTVEDGAQEAPTSAPEPALMDEDRGDARSESDNDTLRDDVTMDVGSIVDKLAMLTERYGEAIGQVESLTRELSALRAERDSALANVELAKQLFSRIEQLPLRRKTAPTPTDPDAKDFRKYAGVLDAEVIKLLEKK